MSAKLLAQAHLDLAPYIVREAAERYSNHRAVNSLGAYLREHGVAGIDEIDTRALTRHLRDHGAMAAAIVLCRPGPTS